MHEPEPGASALFNKNRTRRGVLDYGSKGPRDHGPQDWDYESRGKGKPSEG
jgi:hypothetical protein